MVGHTSYYQTSPPIIRHCKNSWLKRWRLSPFFVCKICFLIITDPLCCEIGDRQHKEKNDQYAQQLDKTA